jgi:hypothetical protein
MKLGPGSLFNEEYWSAYSDSSRSDNNDVLDKLQFLESRAKVCWSDMLYLTNFPRDERDIILDTYRSHSVSLKEEGKFIWLFDESNLLPTEDNSPIFNKHIRKIIIQRNDINLTINDCIVLVYMQYQDEDTLHSLENLSLPLIRDIFEPLADVRINAWFKKHYG